MKLFFVSLSSALALNQKTLGMKNLTLLHLSAFQNGEREGGGGERGERTSVGKSEKGAENEMAHTDRH